jgi:hypothetical protein
MHKVPVGGSIAHAYRFFFGRFFQIIGLSWLPAGLYGAALYAFLKAAPGWMAPLTQSQDVLAGGLASLGIFIVVALLCRAVLGISLTQEALNIRHDFALAHFVIGPREVRLIFAYVQIILIVIVLSLVVGAALTFGLKAANDYGAKLVAAPLIMGKSPVALGALVLAVVIAIAYGLALLRLTFLIVPVAAVEHHASVGRGWALTAGSAWRILFVLLGTFIPFAILCGVASYALGIPALAAALPKGGAPMAMAHATLQMYADHAMLFASFAAVSMAIGNALLAGATATAYRATTGHEEPDLEDDSALVAPLVAPVEESHGSHDDHGHGGGGHDDHGHGGHDDHGHGGHDDHGHGHDDNGHGHGGHDDHGHGGGHDDHGHGGHDDHGHGDDHAHGGHDDHGHGNGHGDHGHHDDHGSDGHGHGGHDDHGHGNGHGHGDHGHASHDDHGHGNGHGDDHGHGDHGHGDHGHGGDGHHHHARAA